MTLTPPTFVMSFKSRSVIGSSGGAEKRKHCRQRMAMMKRLNMASPFFKKMKSSLCHQSIGINQDLISRSFAAEGEVHGDALFAHAFLVADPPVPGGSEIKEKVALVFRVAGLVQAVPAVAQDELRGPAGFEAGINLGQDGIALIGNKRIPQLLFGSEGIENKIIVAYLPPPERASLTVFAACRDILAQSGLDAVVDVVERVSFVVPGGLYLMFEVIAGTPLKIGIQLGKKFWDRRSIVEGVRVKIEIQIGGDIQVIDRFDEDQLARAETEGVHIKPAVRDIEDKVFVRIDVRIGDVVIGDVGLDNMFKILEAAVDAGFDLSSKAAREQPPHILLGAASIQNGDPFRFRRQRHFIQVDGAVDPMEKLTAPGMVVENILFVFGIFKVVVSHPKCIVGDDAGISESEGMKNCRDGGELLLDCLEIIDADSREKVRDDQLVFLPAKVELRSLGGVDIQAVVFIVGGHFFIA